MIDDTDYGQHTHRELTILRQEIVALKAKIREALGIAHDLDNYPDADAALDYIAELLFEVAPDARPSSPGPTHTEQESE